MAQVVGCEQNSEDKVEDCIREENYGDVFDVGLLGQAEIQRIKILSNSEDIPSVLMQSSMRQRRRLKTDY